MTMASTIRYRDQIERELYVARRDRDASRRAVATTDRPETAQLHRKIIASLDAKIARLEAEAIGAPHRPRDQGGFRRALGPLDTLGITYSVKAGSMAGGGDPLDIPEFLRRTK